MTDFTDETLRMNFTGKPELSFGSPGWSSQGVSAPISGGQGMNPMVAASLIQGGSSLLGGLFGAGGKKKDRQHQMDMLKMQIDAAEKAQRARWDRQKTRQKTARRAIAPEQGFIPTYQSLKEVNPMLQKFFGGQMQKLFGGADAFGLGDVFSTIQDPGYTGFEQEKAPLKKLKKKKKKTTSTSETLPSYFRDRYIGRRRGGGR